MLTIEHPNRRFIRIVPKSLRNRLPYSAHSMSYLRINLGVSQTSPSGQIRLFDANLVFRNLRNRFFAHRERVDLTAAFANANTRRLGRLLLFLDQLHDALWQLFMNGRKPVLRPARHSGRQILQSPLPRGLLRSQDAQEWITRETKKILKHVSDSYAARA
jgi:hypothetical protein